MKKRGYFGIGIYNGKSALNLGTLWRSAYQMGAAFIFTVGHRYQRRNCDTYKTWKHIPLMEFDTWEDFKKCTLYDLYRVAVEFAPGSVKLNAFKHPERAVYILGAEDTGLPAEVVKDCHHLLEIESVGQQSYNVAVAGSLVMYDRQFNLKT